MSLSASSSSGTLTDHADQDAPLVVNLVAYDLLPPSRLNSVLNFVGAGIYHTAVAIELPVAGRNKAHLPARELEWAFGGHQQQGQTGVFTLPVGTAARRMPGLRYHSTTEIGPAFGPEWQKVQAKKRRAVNPTSLSKASTSQTPPPSLPPSTSHSASDATLAPYGRYPDSRSSSHLTLATESFAFKAMEEIDLTVKRKTRAEDGSEAEDEDDGEWDDVGASDGTQHFTRTQRRAYRIMREMQDDPEWSGTKYKLLGRNCNSFSDELTHRLTGKRAPGWINRAAWFATSLPCLVPEGWIDEADDIVEDSAAPGSQTVAPTPAKPMTTRSPRPPNDF